MAEGRDEDAKDLTMIGAVSEAPGVRTIRLDNSAGLVPTHRAGQHVKLGVETPQGLAWKSFSLSSPPTRPSVLEVTVKLKPDGAVSRRLHGLSPGDTIRVKGPSGDFAFDPATHREPLVLIAAGIGITPIMSIVRSIRDLAINREVTMIYGCRPEAERPFARELDAVPADLATFRLIVRLSRIDPEFLVANDFIQASSRYFLCGPGDFNATIEQALIDRGVSARCIHQEVFGKVR